MKIGTHFETKPHKMSLSALRKQEGGNEKIKPQYLVCTPYNLVKSQKACYYNSFFFFLYPGFYCAWHITVSVHLRAKTASSLITFVLNKY